MDSIYFFFLFTFGQRMSKSFSASDRSAKIKYLLLFDHTHVVHHARKIGTIRRVSTTGQWFTVTRPAIRGYASLVSFVLLIRKQQDSLLKSVPWYIIILSLKIS